MIAGTDTHRRSTPCAPHGNVSPRSTHRCPPVCPTRSNAPTRPTYGYASTRTTHGYCATPASASNKLNIGRRSNGTKRPRVSWDRAGAIVMTGREHDTNGKW
jgi:hypothetical protein